MWCFEQEVRSEGQVGMSKPWEKHNLGPVQVAKPPTDKICVKHMSQK